MIRKANYDKDLLNLHTLVNRVNCCNNGHVNRARWPKDISDDEIKEDIDHMYVYEENKIIIGCVKIVKHQERKVCVSLLAVEKEYRKQGIGSKLMVFAEKFGDVIEVFIISNQPYLVYFYENIGYDRVDVINIADRIPNKLLTRFDLEFYVYRKKIKTQENLKENIV